MTTPSEPKGDDPQDDSNTAVPAANPAYATPPPEGLPDGDND
jgi:hypothetical protein